MPIRSLKSQSGRRGKTGGLSMVESIFYTVVLAMLLVSVIGTYLSIRGAYQQLKYSSALQNSAIVGFDKMERSIRNASWVDASNSTFQTSPGVLTLNGEDASGNTEINQIYVSNGVLRLKRGSTLLGLSDVGALTDDTVTVESLYFYYLSNANTAAVRIVATFRSTAANFSRADKYYDTVMVGGSN